MHNRRPDLIVPIRDRRRGRRILTVRTVGITLASMVVLFIGISVISELRAPAGNDFGRLYSREIPAPPVVRKNVDIIKEAPPIDDQISADPMLVAPLAREQWLYENGTNAAALASIEPVVAPTPAVTRSGDAKVAIVGGPEGVAIVKTERQRPVLRGGFMRE